MRQRGVNNRATWLLFFLRFTSQSVVSWETVAMCAQSVFIRPRGDTKTMNNHLLEWFFFFFSSSQGCVKKQAVTRKAVFTFVEPVSDAVEDDPVLPGRR